MIFLIVTLGLLNIGLGFGLAMYYGFGPPGLDGLFEALGPMPSAPPNTESFISGKLGAPYDPSAAAESAAGPGADQQPDGTTAPSLTVLAPEALAEEEVLGDVRELATAAQSAMAGGQVESRE